MAAVIDMDYAAGEEDHAMAAKKTTKKAALKKPAPAVKAAPAVKPAPTPAPAAKKPAPAAKKPGAGIAFKSAGLRLTVINELLDLGHFADAFEAAQESAEEVEEFTIDPRVQAFVDGITLTEELLAQVVKIAPDGGDEIYAALMPGWDGEDDAFDIDSLDELRLLPNLERVSLFAMVKQGIDLTPLGAIPGLTHVNVNLAKSWAKGWSTLDALDARGIEVTRMS